MSRKSRRNAHKKTPRPVEARRAMLSILNVGDGDTKVSFDRSNPGDRERACRIVTDMLKRGYAVLVAAGEKNGRPLYYRATGFDPQTCEYIIAGVPEEDHAASALAPIQGSSPRPAPSPRRRGRPRRVPAETTPAVSVARSAGGMSTAANSVEARNGFALLNHFDGLSGLRNKLSEIACERSEWAGIPMPLEDCPLVVEPRYPMATALMAMSRRSRNEDSADDDLAGAKVINQFYSARRRCDIIVFRKSDGTTDWGVQRASHSFDQQLQTLGNSDAWGIEQEANAIQTLAALVSHRQFKQYMLTGSFVEKSMCSGKSYIFRKLRPTVAMTERDGRMVILAALCMHPIAYYQGSWAGAMCPTDDVIAHLMLMRGDEHMFWKRANQHPAWRPEAGL